MIITNNFIYEHNPQDFYVIYEKDSSKDIFYIVFINGFKVRFPYHKLGNKMEYDIIQELIHDIKKICDEHKAELILFPKNDMALYLNDDNGFGTKIDLDENHFDINTREVHIRKLYPYETENMSKYFKK